MSYEFPRCMTCMFFDLANMWCDANDDNTHPDFGCEKHKEKVKNEM